MKLYEKEAKELLSGYGTDIPETDGEEYVVKAQVLAKDRMNDGGIKFAENREEAERIAREMKDTEVNGYRVKDVLIEEKIDYEREYYVAFLYDTEVRSPVMVFSTEGGTGIEHRESEKLVLDDIQQWKFRQFLRENNVSGREMVKLASTMEDMAEAFIEEDARMIEVNPLVISDGTPVAIDAMVELDDDAFFRHERDYPERSAFARDKTEREKKAERIDRDDHRGIAGKYTELEGDIGMLTAGGGASLTNMDALKSYGGEPANYTEYGGNPPAEKVYKLSKIVMSKDLNGIWHVGGTANNTDIYRTMKGFCRALEEEKPDYPIVVRRDGPNADKGFELLKEKREELDLEMELYRNDTPMTVTAEKLMEMVKEYKEKGEVHG